MAKTPTHVSKGFSGLNAISCSFMDIDILKRFRPWILKALEFEGQIETKWALNFDDNVQLDNFCAKWNWVESRWSTTKFHTFYAKHSSKDKERSLKYMESRTEFYTFLILGKHFYFEKKKTKLWTTNVVCSSQRMESHIVKSIHVVQIKIRLEKSLILVKKTCQVKRFFGK